MELSRGSRSAGLERGLGGLPSHGRDHGVTEVSLGGGPVPSESSSEAPGVSLSPGCEGDPAEGTGAERPEKWVKISKGLKGK